MFGTVINAVPNDDAGTRRSQGRTPGAALLHKGLHHSRRRLRQLPHLVPGAPGIVEDDLHQHIRLEDNILFPRGSRWSQGGTSVAAKSIQVLRLRFLLMKNRFTAPSRTMLVGQLGCRLSVLVRVERRFSASVPSPSLFSVVPSITTPGLSTPLVSLNAWRPTSSPQKVFFFYAKHCGGSYFRFLPTGILRSSIFWFHDVYPATAPRFSTLVSPRLTGRRAAHSSARSSYRFPQDDPGLPQSNQLRIRPFMTEHPVQPHRQSPRHHHLGHRAIALAHPQPFVGPLQLLVPLHRRLPGFTSRNRAQARTLLADVSQPLLAPELTHWDQPQVRAHRPRRAKAAHLAQGQHRGQRRLRPHSRMRLQPQRRWTPLHLGPHPHVHLRDLLVQLRHPLQQIIPPPRRVLGQVQTASSSRPASVHSPRPSALLVHRQACSWFWPPSAPAPDDADPNNSCRVPLFLRRHPDPRKPLLQHHLQDQLGIFPVRLFFPTAAARMALHRLPTARARIRPANAGTTGKALPPRCLPVPARLAPATAVKLYRLLRMFQPLFPDTRPSIVKDRENLKPSMEVTTQSASFAPVSRRFSSHKRIGHSHQEPTSL